jgi:glutathione S-transferase
MLTPRVTAFRWVPPFAWGLVRDLRVRWAHEEAGLPYEAELVDRERLDSAPYRAWQPFGQVPAYRDGPIQLFESGAIVLHIARKSRALAPADEAGQARVSAWVIAALSSVEPHVQNLSNLDSFHREATWAPAYRPVAEAAARRRLASLEAWLSGRDYLEGGFTAADIMMSSVLRELDHTEILADYPRLSDYHARCEARPAFQRALEAQLTVFREAAPAETIAS